MDGWHRLYNAMKFSVYTCVLCSIPADYAEVIYSTGVRYGGEREWDFVWNRTQTTHVVSEAEIMMTSLGRTQSPWLMWRHVEI